jgi:hypothetical protein
VAAVIYSLCTLTAGLCAWRLLAAFARTRHQLLAWGGVCFAVLTLNNLLLVIDRVLLPEIDLFSLRLVTALIAISALLYGLIRDSR